MNVAPHNECPDADRASKFVGSDGHRGSAKLAEIDVEFTNCLGGIRVKPYAMVITDDGQFTYGLNDACFVVRQHCRNQPCLRPKYATQIVNADYAARVNAQSVDLPPTPFERIGEGCDAWMLDGGDDEVARQPLTPPDFQTARKWYGEVPANGEVIRLGTAAGEDDVVFWVGTEEFGNSIAGVFEDPSGAAAEFVLAGGVQIRFGPAGAHGFHNIRKNRRRGVVVEINAVEWRTRHESMIQRSAVVTQNRQATPVAEIDIAGWKTGPV